MKKIVKLTESDLGRMVKRVMNESVIFDNLEEIWNKCGNQPPTPTSKAYATDIYDAMDYQHPKTTMGRVNQVATFGLANIGTDEEKLINTFKSMKTFDEFCSTKNSYLLTFKKDMLEAIDSDVDTDDVWKEIGRTIEVLYEKKDEELENRAKQCGYNSVQEYKASNWFCKLSSDQNSELLSNARKCGHKSIVDYKNSGWSCKGSGGGQSNLITLGSTDPKVVQIQKKLGVSTKGGYGLETQKAVMKFQNTYGQTSVVPKTRTDGVVDDYTYWAIMGKEGVNERYSPRSQRKIVKLTEKDLTNIVKGVINEDVETLVNAKKCGYKSVEEYKNANWKCNGVKGKIVKENLSTRTGDLYAGINELIDREFDDVEPSEVVRILSNILKHHEGRVYRDKHNIKPITSKEVVKNFRNFRRD